MDNFCVDILDKDIQDATHVHECDTYFRCLSYTFCYEHSMLNEVKYLEKEVEDYAKEIESSNIAAYYVELKAHVTTNELKYENEVNRNRV